MFSFLRFFDSLGLVACGKPEGKSIRMLRVAESDWRAGDKAGAIQKLDTAIELNPKNHAAHMLEVDIVAIENKAAALEALRNCFHDTCRKPMKRRTFMTVPAIPSHRASVTPFGRS
ncbi:MAG: hypothetical protein ACR2RL_15175 [Gammaproteobacteria bacterium]